MGKEHPSGLKTLGGWGQLSGKCESLGPSPSNTVKMLKEKGKTTNNRYAHREAEELIHMTRVGRDLGTRRPGGQSDLKGVACSRPATL